MDLVGLLSLLGGNAGNSPSGLMGLNWADGGLLPQGVGGGVYAQGAGNPWGGGMNVAPPWYTDPRKLMLLSSMFGTGQRQQQPAQPSPMPMFPNNPPNLGGLFQPRQRSLSLRQPGTSGGY